MTQPTDDFSINALYSTSVKASSLTGEAADRIAIRELIDAWGHCADRRKPEQQANLFTADGTVLIYEGEPGTKEPVAVLRGQAGIIASLDVLNKYDATTHFNGQSALLIDGIRAVGETYCLAHHLWVENGQRTLMVMSIRYYDKFVREADRWLFAERKLIIDWTDSHPSQP
ncbi:nuclear transport factor 2 family protein [Ktedonobacter robiniae]|uniref:SnoaL-like domain-containing protein n=1 Tax=Ktedonobacter robiniae TaxID=2778365 RepID=A0ABQ3V6M1_9CHLR|nr:nuclear transport factor 2 family protein [Ktedonobacter robiniae]GHO60519.1 hypothetical protein KSB_89940 [Ktedonobacter robiniae]